MGQYYHPAILTANGKVKEWASSHDYDNGLKLMEHSYIGNSFVNVILNRLIDNPQRLVWAGDYADEEKDGETIYSKCGDIEPIQNGDTRNNTCRFGINHDKKQFVDLDKVETGKWEMRIHPVPLLTCEGNGRGGGDFRGESKYLGTWSRDRISLSNTVPDGFAEIVPNFTEDR